MSTVTRTAPPDSDRSSNDALDNIGCYTKSIGLQGNTSQRLKKVNAGSNPYLVRPWHKRMLEDAAAKVSAQRIDGNGMVRRDETRHTLGGSTDVQWEDGKIDDAQVVRSVHLPMGLAVRVQIYAGESILLLTFNCGPTTPPLSRGSIEQVPDVSAYAI